MEEHYKQASKVFRRIIPSFTSILPLVLISSVMGILFTAVIVSSMDGFFTHGLRRQLSILLILSGGLGIVCYFLLKRLRLQEVFLTVSSEPGLRVFVRKIFLAVFFLFPVSLILAQHAVEFFHILRTGQAFDPIGWLSPSTDLRVFLIQSLALSSSIILAVFTASTIPSLRSHFESMSDAYYCSLIVLLNLAMRLPFIFFINTQPVSDFANINNDAILIAQGAAPINFYATTHVTATVIYSWLYRIFGIDLVVIKLFHTVLYGLAAIFIYLAGRRVFESRLWAAMTALLLLGWPSLIPYSTVFTPEHLFILAECALLFLAAAFFNEQQTHRSETSKISQRREMLWLVAIGLLIGISGLFRPFGELVLIAFVLTLLLYIRKKSLRQIAVSMFCLCIPFWVVSYIPTAIINSYPYGPLTNVRPCNLLVGMSFEFAGQYNDTDRELCTQLRIQAGDEAGFTRNVLRFVWERFQMQKDDSIKFVVRKFSILWTNSNGILFWALGDVVGRDRSFIQDIARKANLVDFAIMSVITSTCLIGTGIAFFRDVKPVIFFSLLTFFGFNLMEIPLEVQNRYRTVVMPLMFFFACWTFATISSAIYTRNQAGTASPNVESDQPS